MPLLSYTNNTEAMKRWNRERKGQLQWSVRESMTFRFHSASPNAQIHEDPFLREDYAS